MKAMTAKPIHLRKLAAITEVKGKTLLSKNFIIMPVFSLGFTFLINMIYSRIMDGAADMSAYALALGVLMNISMTGIYSCPGRSDEYFHDRNLLCIRMSGGGKGEEYTADAYDVFGERTGVFPGEPDPCSPYDYGGQCDLCVSCTI